MNQRWSGKNILAGVLYTSYTDEKPVLERDRKQLTLHYNWDCDIDGERHDFCALFSGRIRSEILKDLERFERFLKDLKIRRF